MSNFNQEDWRERFVPRFQTIEAVSLGWHEMIRAALQSSDTTKKVYVRDWRMDCRVDPIAFIARLTEVLGPDFKNIAYRPPTCKVTPSSERKGEKPYWHVAYAASKTIVVARGQVGSATEVDGCSFDDEILVKVEDLCMAMDSSVLPEDKPGVDILVARQGGLGFEHKPSIGKPLIRENYDSDTMAFYDKIVEGLGSESPKARLVIMCGTPGSGKSYMVRGLLHDLHAKTRPILIPSDTVSQLSHPDLLPLLADHRKNVGKPLLLILEDADDALTRRDASNMRAVSSLLNMTDGMMAEIADVRIVATSNARRLDMDRAILRPGRLLAEHEITKLSPEKAREVWDRLHAVDNKEYPFTPKQAVTLAEIYAGELQPDVERTGFSR